MQRFDQRAMHFRHACIALIFLMAAGCASTAETPVTGERDGETTEATSTAAVHSKTVYVLVDGKEKGQLPATIRVRRGLGARMVSLWQSGEEIRTYELQTVQTADGIALEYSFFGEESPSTTTYDTSALPTSGENNYVVPYSPYRITVEDRQYRLTLIVEE